MFNMKHNIKNVGNYMFCNIKYPYIWNITVQIEYRLHNITLHTECHIDDINKNMDHIHICRLERNALYLVVQLTTPLVCILLKSIKNTIHNMYERKSPNQKMKNYRRNLTIELKMRYELLLHKLYMVAVTPLNFILCYNMYIYECLNVLIIIVNFS